MYHGLTYKRACVSPEIDSWHARSVHTYTLRSIGLLLDIGTYTPFVPFPPSKKEQKDPSGAHYRQGLHRTKSARTIVWHPHLVTKPLSAAPSLLWITLAFCSWDLSCLRFYLHHMASVAAGDLNPDTSTTERERERYGRPPHSWARCCTIPPFHTSSPFEFSFFLRNSNPTVFLRAERDRITLFRCP